MFFGICHTSKSCQGMFYLLNPIDVPAKWNLTHEPMDSNTENVRTAIRVDGYNERGPDVDDPSVFEITPTSGLLFGPTISTANTSEFFEKERNKK